MTNSDTTINECLYPSGVYYRGYEGKRLGAGMKLLVQYFGWVFFFFVKFELQYNRSQQKSVLVKIVQL